jgi:cystathionine beta-lyase/cystathionine gamma-synthase
MTRTFVIREMLTPRVRLEQRGINGPVLANWLEARAEVARATHPGLETDPQHVLTTRQFSGSCGLFGLQLEEGYSGEAVDSFLDGLELFSTGHPWGGYESLMLRIYSLNIMRADMLQKYGDDTGTLGVFMLDWKALTTSSRIQKPSSSSLG